jgi:glycosyltransferase involved in cell wall biosynthesis
VPTVVADGKTGLLVPPGDVDSLAEGILSLLRDPEMRARFGAAAKQRVEDEYSASRMTADYLRVYAEAIESSDLPTGSNATSRGNTK